MRSNPKGVHCERWRHVHGCGRWFNLARDTVSDQILAVYRMGEPRPKIERRRPGVRPAAIRPELTLVGARSDEAP